jgi:DNA sulfur modification protein DndD
MIINKLMLENFGLYAGKHEFDLAPKRDKNIILIGGQNGNGKTTFFDAIRLCLYGSRIIEGPFKKKNYEKFLIEKIHKNSRKNIDINFARIELEFQYSTLGELEYYKVVRSWKKLNGGVVESFSVEKNNDLLELDPEQWQEFVSGLIPPGLTKLFFFDGEKLQNLAGDLKGGDQLGDSFDALMGIDLVEKLMADLKIYSSKNLKVLSSEDKGKLAGLEKRREKESECISDIFIIKAGLRVKIDQINLSIEKLNEKISSEGGSFAMKKDELELKIKNYENNLLEIEDEMRLVCAGRLPFVFSSNLNNKLKESLSEEEKVRKNKNFSESVKEKFDSLDVKKIMNNKFSSKDIGNILENVKKEFTKDIFVGDKKAIHGFSEVEIRKINILIDMAVSEDKGRFLELSKKYESLLGKINKMQREVKFAPEESAIKPYFDKLIDLNRELGYRESEINSLEEDVRLKEFEIERINREIKKIDDRSKFKKNLINKAKIVEKVQKVLGRYSEEFKSLKIKEFSEEFIKSFNFLMRKKDLCSKIVVDPKNYEVTLFNSSNEKIPRRMLSAGEKQIYALAVLWTLTKISKRPLPFIIDTPMGRLDKEHRDSFVLDFLPKAGQQLIILSTNSEIDVEYAKKLSPFLAKKIILEYADGETKPVKGYFKK